MASVSMTLRLQMNRWRNVFISSHFQRGRNNCHKDNISRLLHNIQITFSPEIKKIGLWITFWKQSRVFSCIFQFDYLVQHTLILSMWVQMESFSRATEGDLGSYKTTSSLQMYIPFFNKHITIYIVVYRLNWIPQTSPAMG